MAPDLQADLPSWVEVDETWLSIGGAKRPVAVVLGPQSERLDLPPRFGHWNSVFRRHCCWFRAGVWTRMLAVVADERANLSRVHLDSSYVR